MASPSIVVDDAVKLHDYKDFEPNCKSSSGASAAAIGYLQFWKICRTIENLIEDIIMFLLKRQQIVKSLSR